MEKIDRIYELMGVRKPLLVESDSRLKAVNRTIDAELGDIYPLDQVVTDANKRVDGNPNTTWRQYLMYTLQHDFDLMGNANLKYLPFVARIAFSDEVGFKKRNGNVAQIAELNKILLYLKKNPEEFDAIKNDMSIDYNKLVGMFSDAIKAQDDAEEVKIANMGFSNSTRNKDYEIRTVGYAEAHEIGNLSSDQKGGQLCYTQSKGTWNNYTANGANKAYVLLKKGWQDMEPKPGLDAPKDEYGKSMIFVFIAPNGDIVYSNTRWNHKHASGTIVDHSFTASELSEILGVNYKIVLKPYSEEELKSKGIITFKRAQELLDSGEELRNIFDRVYEKLENGLTPVMLNNKNNFVTENNKLLRPDMWFDKIEWGDDCLIRIYYYGKCNYINKDGSFVWNKPTDMWFDFMFYTESIDVYIVADNRKYNFVNKDGVLVFNDWFDAFYYNHNYDVITVKKDGKYNLINRSLKLFLEGPTKNWYDDVKTYHCGFNIVRIGDKYNYIDTNGDLLWEKPIEEWFDGAHELHDNVGLVRKNRKFNYIKNDKTLLWNKPEGDWLDEALSFINDLSRIQKDGKYNYISLNGDLLWDKPEDDWFDRAYVDTECDYLPVTYHGQEAYLGRDGILYDSQIHPIKESIVNRIIIESIRKILGNQI